MSRGNNIRERKPAFLFLLLYVYLIAAMTVFSACSLISRPGGSGQETLPDWLQVPTPREYVLEAGDVCDLKLFYHPELNENEVTVRPDGKISLQLIGDVEAKGKTPAALISELTERYSRAGLLQPAVSITLRKSAGLRVFVGGEVRNPGMFQYEGPLTLSRAILQAGGPVSTSALEHVVVLRDSQAKEAQHPLFAVVDFEKLMEGGQDPLLQPYDIVFLPKSTIATMNQFVDQYLVKMIPVTLTAGFSYSMGSFDTKTLQ